jgi:ribose transport system substrate-binding protein
MKMRMRRNVAMATAVALALGVAACGGSDSSGGGSASGGTSSTESKSSGKPANIAIVVPAPSRYWNEPWTAAANDAASKGGFKAQFVGPPGSQVFNLTQQNSLLDSLAAKGVNGFGIFPGDAQGSNAEIKKLGARGVKVITVNGCTVDPTDALFCVSTNVGPAAKYQAEQLIKAIGGEGNIALLTSQTADTNTKLRIDAVKEAVDATGGKVKLVQTITDPGSLQDAKSQISALLSAKGKSLAGIMSTSENPSVAAATLFTDNAEYRHIKFIGAENSPQVMDAIGKGYITGTLFQNTYGMAYVAAYALGKVIQDGCTVKPDATFQSNTQTKKLVEAGVLVVDKSNFDQYKQGHESLPSDTEKLLAQVNDQVLSCG